MQGFPTSFFRALTDTSVHVLKGQVEVDSYNGISPTGLEILMDSLFGLLIGPISINFVIPSFF